MDERPPARIDINQRKRWAGYFFRIDIQSGGESLYKNSLPRAEWTVEEDDFSTA